MEPLVVVSAAVVVVFGYRTAKEVISDIEQDGSWELIQEQLSRVLSAARSVRRTLSGMRSHKIVCYGNCFLPPKKGHAHSIR